MSLAVESTSTSRYPSAEAGPDTSPSPFRANRRSGRRAAVGLLLVLASVVTFWQVDLRAHAGESFLATTRAVAAGQLLTDADVQVVRIADDSGLALIAASRRDQIVGRVAAVPLAAASLLSLDQLGPAVWPPTGQAVTAVAVKAGRGPAGLATGTRVLVLVVPTGTRPDSAGPIPANGDAPGVRRAVATVVSVDVGGDQAGGQLVTLLLAAADAEAIAVAAGDVAIVQLGAE